MARFRLPLIVAIILSLFVIAPAEAEAPARSARSVAWESLARNAYAKFLTQDTAAVEGAFGYAYAVQTIAWLDGWTDPAITTYLDRVYAKTKPDGGYGLDYAYDAHGDGTTNPASTSYVVTMTDHVGMMFIDGVKAGVVPIERVATLANLVLTAPRIDHPYGRCIAYSLNPNDAKTGLCVHNVNAGAAVFLLDAAKLGALKPTPWWLIAGIAKREAANWDATTKFWEYRDNMVGPQDADHNSYNAESVLRLADPIGYTTSLHHMVNTFTDTPEAPIAHIRLAGVAGARFCALGDRWLSEATTYLASTSTATRSIQVAYYAARAARVCA